MNKHFDTPTVIVIIVTFVLFAVALFVKGFTHDLLLEAGVFLVSVKLMLMGYKNSVTNKKMMDELQEIKNRLAEKQNTEQK
jgi:Na+-translocating ferredoxin:NAD+ oxidoreductase RnfE subunit